VPTAAGEYAATLSASNEGGTGSAPLTVSVSKAPAAVTLLGLQQTYDGLPKSVTVTTAPTGLPVTLNYDGQATPPTNAGSYAVTATVVHQNYAGSASDVLSVAKATAAVQITSLDHVYDGTPKQVTTTTSPAGLSVLVTYNSETNAPVYPGEHDVVALVVDGNHVGTASATMNISISALVRRASVLNGVLEGSLQMLAGGTTALNSGATLSGDFLVPGVPQILINGQPTYAGQKTGPGQGTPSNYSVTLNNGAVLRYLVTRVDPIEMPIVPLPPAPSGTRSVTISRASDAVGDFATLRNLTLNSGAKVAVPPGNYGSFITNGSATLTLGVADSPDVAQYSFESLTLNGKTPIRVVGKVHITVAGSVSVAGEVGDAENPDRLTWRFSSGGLTLNSGAVVHGTVVAPYGTVTINGNTMIRGQIATDTLVLNSNGTLEDPAVAPAP
jgi:rhamnogalacturonan endolyase